MRIFKKLFYISLLLPIMVFANDISGKWLITQIKTKDKTQESFAEVELKNNGTFMIMSMNFGTYEHPQGSKKFILKSDKDKDLPGDYTITKLDATKMVLKKNIQELYEITFLKINSNIEKTNEHSSLAGTWSIQGQDNLDEFAKFTLPYDFKYYSYEDGISTTVSGMWIYDKDTKKVTVAARRNPLSGTSNVKKTTTGFVLSNLKHSLTIKPLAPLNVEHLNYTENDLPQDPSGSLPAKWSNFELMAEYLGTLDFVQYKIGTYLEQLQTMRYSSYRSKIKTTQKPSVTFTNVMLKNNKEGEQFSQRYKGGLSESYNLFFPQEEFYQYRITGKESIKVPAGKFLCSVIEAIKGDDKMKLWLIDDKPGLYAKIITETTDPFGKTSYQVEELESIHKKGGK